MKYATGDKIVVTKCDWNNGCYNGHEATVIRNDPTSGVCVRMLTVPAGTECVEIPRYFSFLQIAPAPDTILPEDL